MLATFGTGLVQPLPNVVPVSLVTPVTLSKEPVAEDMRFGAATVAAKSVPFPTWLGFSGGFSHETSSHAVAGYVALKHPFLGSGARNMASCEALRRAASSRM